MRLRIGQKLMSRLGRAFGLPQICGSGAGAHHARGGASCYLGMLQCYPGNVTEGTRAKSRTGVAVIAKPYLNYERTAVSLKNLSMPW